jgi:hypothetical protein
VDADADDGGNADPDVDSCAGLIDIKRLEDRTAVGLTNMHALLLAFLALPRLRITLDGRARVRKRSLWENQEFSVRLGMTVRTLTA